MQRFFNTIGVIGKLNDSRVASTLTSVCAFLRKQDYQVFVEEGSAQFVCEPAQVRIGSAKQLGEACDVVIVLGGDGTFLAAARDVASSNIPLIGVNLGRLGFLVDISPDTLTQTLAQMLSGNYTQEERCLLRAQIVRDQHIIHEETAMNEVAIHRWITPSMIEIVTKIDGVFLNSQRSDGLIIATPTGSTAYSLSAGGPILYPSLNALVLVPLNPHTLSNRPIVIHDGATIEISFCQRKQINALVTCDHVEIPDVLISDKILVTKAPKPITILHPAGYDFFDILRSKLNWG